MEDPGEKGNSPVWVALRPPHRNTQSLVTGWREIGVEGAEEARPWGAASGEEQGAEEPLVWVPREE